VGRVNDHAVVDEAAQIVALAHVSEEIFLRPSTEHGWRQNRCGVLFGVQFWL
jgi:hypothetical protein